MMTEQDPIARFLAHGGYATAEDWARDSDYTERDGEWFDADGHPVSIESAVEAALEAVTSGWQNDLIEKVYAALDDGADPSGVRDAVEQALDSYTPDPDVALRAAHNAGEHTTTWDGCPICQDVG